jgi:hypothetical protein
MKITRAKLEDVPRIIECAREFTSKIPDCPLDDIHYVTQWNHFINNNIGVIFLLEDQTSAVLGGIGGLMHPDLLTGRKTAVELFWYIKEEHRRGTWPVRLLKEFEAWAKAGHCYDVAMIHMECSMPDRLKEFYGRRGYRLFETMYRKVLA